MEHGPGAQWFSLRTGLILIAAFVALLLPPQKAAAFELPDTAANRARGVVGCIQSAGGITCPGGAAGMMGAMTGGALEQQLLGDIFGLVMQSALAGLEEQASQEALERQQQLEQQRKALERELARQEEERREQERQAREAWLRERDRTYGQLKGPKPGETLGLKLPETVRKEIPAQLRRLHCSQHLAKKAEAAVARGQHEEAAYLNEQAVQAMAGGHLSVKCPEPPAPPEVVGAPVLADAPPPETQFYTALMKLVKGSLDELSATAERLKALQEQRRAAAASVHGRQQEMARLRQDAGSAPPADHERRLAEAQRGHDEAVRAEAEVSRDLQQAIGQQQEIIAALKQQENLFRRVQASPQAAKQLLPKVAR